MPSFETGKCGSAEPSLGCVDFYEPLDIQVKNEGVNIHIELLCGGGSHQLYQEFIPTSKSPVIPSLGDSELFGLTEPLTKGFSYTSQWMGSGLELETLLITFPLIEVVQIHEMAWPRVY